MSDNNLSPPPLPARPLARPTSRRSLRSLSSNQDDPLSSPSSLADTEPSSSSPSSTPGGSGQYAIYSSVKRRPSANPLSDTPSSPPSTSSSSIPTPPFHPAISLAPPPLVSRPSNSTLPSPSGRSYARSVSEAKEQLQKQALKAELQKMGVQNDSWGAGLVTKLAAIGEEAELSSIVELVKSGKAALLLPSEKLDFPTTIQTANLLDHLILPSRRLTPATDSSPRSFVTLSGLRGSLTAERLVFDGCGLAVRASDHGIIRQSALEPQVDYSSDDLHRYLRGPASSDSDLVTASTSYPHFDVVSPTSTLSLPRTASAAPSVIAAASRTNTSSRLAALFSKSASAQTSTPPESSTSSSNGSIDSSPSSSTTKSLPNLEIPVIVIGFPVRFSEVTKQVYSTLNEGLRSSLSQVEGVKGDQSALDRITTFVNRFQPPSPTWTSVFTPSTPSSTNSSTISLFNTDIETISEAFQDLLHSTRLDLSRNLSIASPTAPPTTMDDSANLEDFGVLEERVDSTLSELEDILLSTALYPHVFSPPFSSDAQDDENLASRIAALNVLELSLEHLGVELGSAEEGLPGWEYQKRGVRETVEDLADTVGKELARLENPSDRTASSKLDVFVQVHKILVDELGKLPPIPLKKEVDPATAPNDEFSQEVEMDDASSRASSRAPSRPRSPTPTAITDDELLKTPRPPPAFDQEVPAIALPEASAPVPHELSSSMHEATSSSMFEPTFAAPSPPPSIFDTTARPRSTSISSSSLHSSSAAPSTSTSGADLILPLLIYSVVRSNPPRLTSHLKFSHRFRSESLMRGQASYCLTNFDAVVEFLNHVDVSSLGLSSQKVMAAATPSPSLQSSSPLSSSASSSSRPRAYTTGRLSSRLTTEMPGLIDSANSALSGVVDSSYRMVFGPKGLAAIASGVGGAAPKSLEEVRGVLNGAAKGSRIGLPFRRSTSVMTLSGDGSRPRAATTTSAVPSGTVEDGGGGGGTTNEMIDLPGGSPDVQPSNYSPPASPPHESTLVDSLSPSTSPSKPSAMKDDDTRSIRSISSLIRDTTIGRTLGEMGSTAVGAASTTSGGSVDDRPSFGERLSSIPGLSRFGGGGAEMKASGTSNSASSTRASIFSAFGPSSSGSPRRPSSALPLQHPSANSSTTSLSSNTFKPVRKFLEVNSVDELKLGEVKLLLESYRELVAVWESEKEARLHVGSVSMAGGDSTFSS
ncbi:VPS9 domain-containing protein [Sporobolomyces salmoneus]|uniref:VPS9 domain-containing protein n=1 Tax=Sporobolomyces salmoneus TaxID=183962 RepID=UPI0031738E61